MNALVAGIGNIFNGDDGFGCAVAARLAGTALPEGVHVEDYGIRGIHLAYALLDGFELVVLIDALATGDPPGTVVVVEPDLDAEGAPALDAHRMDPRAVLATVVELGGRLGRVVVVGCQPADVDEHMGLSDPVAAAVDVAVALVRELLVDAAAEVGPAEVEVGSGEGRSR